MLRLDATLAVPSFNQRFPNTFQSINNLNLIKISNLIKTGVAFFPIMCIIETRNVYMEFCQIGGIYMKQRVILAILVCVLSLFASCNINVNGEVNKKSYIVMFSVEGEGTITATIDGERVDSGVVAKEGSIIEFKVSFDEQKYEVNGWKGAIENTFDKTRAKLTVSENITVKAILQNKQEVKVAVNFSEGANGKIKAMLGDRELKSGESVVQNAVVDFEAIPDKGYEVSSWNGATPDDKDKNKAKAVAKAELNISVLFKPINSSDVILPQN